MTRMLSELLGAVEPNFSLNIQSFERASGDPSADIRLTSEIRQRTQAKIQELGLDPHDTTGQELYRVLLERLKKDEHGVRQALHIADDADVAIIALAVEQFVRKLAIPRSCFALKASVAKRLLKKLPPKNALKSLGYRSLDSFIKHEPVALIYAAAWSCESVQWCHDFVKQYESLRPSDFEARTIEVILPKSKRWEKLAAELANHYKHNSLYFKELGAVIMLPLPANLPGIALISLLFAVHEINDIHSASAYFKMQQFKPDFGEIVEQSVAREPYIGASLAGQPLPWRTIQRYYDTYPDAYHADLFDPYIQAEDLEWHHAETVLANVIPTLEFWIGTMSLGFVEHRQPVSLNLFDIALSYCNQIAFADRIIQYMRDNVWHELLLRYLHQDALEQTVLRQLQTELVGEPVLA